MCTITDTLFVKLYRNTGNVTRTTFIDLNRKIPNLSSKVHYIYCAALLVSMFNNGFNIYVLHIFYCEFQECCAFRYPYKVIAHCISVTFVCMEAERNVVLIVMHIYKTLQAT